MNNQHSRHHLARCPVYLHPAAASNPTTIARIQRRTGLLVIVGAGHKAPTLQQPATSGYAPTSGDAA